MAVTLERLNTILAHWAARQDGRQWGWPNTSSEARALRAAMLGSPTDSPTRKAGTMLCKETRPRRHSIIPHYPANIPYLDRLFAGMVLEGLQRETALIQFTALNPRMRRADIAALASLSPRTCRRLRKNGLEWLMVWL